MIGVREYLDLYLRPEHYRPRSVAARHVHAESASKIRLDLRLELGSQGCGLPGVDRDLRGLDLDTGTARVDRLDDDGRGMPIAEANLRLAPSPGAREPNETGSGLASRGNRGSTGLRESSGEVGTLLASEHPRTVTVKAMSATPTDKEP